MLNGHVFPPGIFLYFIYGLTFVFLGVAIASKDMSESRLRLAGSLPFLALFGFTHGIHEWFEMYLLFRGPYAELASADVAALLSLIGSFIFLSLFAISLLRAQPEARCKWAMMAAPFLLLILPVFFWMSKDDVDLNLLRDMEILSRFTVGIFGAGLTSHALFVHARSMSLLSREIAINLRRAGISFGFYAVLTGLIPSHFEFPVIGIQVEVARIAAAIAITFFMVRALNVFNIETRRKLEQQFRQLAQAEKLAALGKLAAGVAHEINNPLTVASLSIQTLHARLKRADADPMILQKLEAAEQNIDRASSIARDLFSLSRESRRELERLEISYIDLNDIIALTISELAPRLNGVAVRQNLTPVPPVRGAADKLRQVFANILDNAVDSMPAGGEIGIRSFAEGPWVVVELSDTGGGIPEEHLGRVFEPFFSTKEAGQGTGLGLSLAHSIINQHNGRIELNSMVDRGTTITIKIPAEIGDGQNPLS